MKTIYKFPYIKNLVGEYRSKHGPWWQNLSGYRDWLKQFGFQVPIRGNYLEFPDDFPDELIAAFVLRWS